MVAATVSPLTLQTLGEDTFIALPWLVTRKFFRAGARERDEGLGVWGRLSPGCEICPSCVNRESGVGWGQGGCDLWWKSKTQKGKVRHRL